MTLPNYIYNHPDNGKAIGAFNKRRKKDSIKLKRQLMSDGYVNVRWQVIPQDKLKLCSVCTSPKNTFLKKKIDALICRVCNGKTRTMV